MSGGAVFKGESHGTRQRKTHALLAAGAVLGVGTVATLAAWNDSEFTTGTFTAGVFDMEGASTDVGGVPEFVQHETLGAAAELQFVVDASNRALARASRHPLLCA
jgi:predicted ribosomally synthesized peptide with SipW-like signal peptide